MIPAGLGLRLHDLLYQTDTHWVFDRWWKYAKQHYVRLPDAGPLEWAAWYYDPLIDYLCLGSSAATSHLVFYLSPQHYDDTQRLYDASRPPVPPNPPPNKQDYGARRPAKFGRGPVDCPGRGGRARPRAPARPGGAAW